MEILIDHKNIPQIADNKPCDFDPNNDEELIAKDNYDICKLRLCHGENQCFINATKDLRSKELKVQMQDPIVSLKACDNAIQAFRWSEEHIPDLGNLSSVSRYRQRQSFLRDIFIETFSQEGNVNVQMPGVRAISNEEYHFPSSVILSNAEKHFTSEPKTLLDMPENYLPQNNSKAAIIDYLQQDHKVRNYSNLRLYYPMYNQVLNNYNAENLIENDLNKIHKWKKATPFEIALPLSSKDSTNFSTARQNNFLNRDETSGVKFSEISKVTIMNQVLQNPWLPKQPLSYTPFPRNDIKSIHIEHTDKNKAFTKKQDYVIHMRRHSSTNRYSCRECHKTFSQIRNFKYHMSVHRGTKEFAATCTVCGKHFNDRGYLSNHMKIHRNRKEYKCASCPKSFNQRVAFNMHIRIHTGLKPHVCEECGKAFSRKMLLKQHQRTHSGERPYACAHCGKRFADRSNMTLHLRLHTGEKPFSCTICPKSFTKKHHLKSHLNFHTGVKPYCCPRCSLAFTQSSNMRTHYKKCNATSSTIC